MSVLVVTKSFPRVFQHRLFCDPSRASRVKTTYKETGNAAQDRTGQDRGDGEGGASRDASSHAAAGGPGWRWESLMASGRLPNSRRRSGPGHATGT